eukprot:SAG31_NODE_318_length_17799_cov_79.857571_9_plen_64_part_00
MYQFSTEFTPVVMSGTLNFIVLNLDNADTAMASASASGESRGAAVQCEEILCGLLYLSVGTCT